MKQLENLVERFENLVERFEDLVEQFECMSDQSTPETVETNMNPEYRFDNFIVNKDNNLAHCAAVLIVENEISGHPNDPLYIYGDHGCGKTHLMTAIGNYISKNTDKNVIYVTAERFIEEMTKAMKEDSKEMIGLVRRKYSCADVLLFDDLQKIVEYPPVLEEFFHILNRRFQEDMAIVITSDKHPVYMKELDERFRSRINRGLIVAIIAPKNLNKEKTK